MNNENLTEEESQRIAYMIEHLDEYPEFPVAYMIEHLDEYPEFPVKSLNDEDGRGYVTEIIV